jgi:hypothetical protein
LHYAAQDAVDIQKAITAAAKKLLNTDNSNHVYSYVLNTDPSGAYTWPYKKNIEEAFSKITKTAKANDIIMVFLSGHGVLSKNDNQFYYLTSEAGGFELNDLEKKKAAISTAELNSWMRNIKAQKQILILDACNSGQVIEGLNVSKDISPDQRRVLEELADMTGMYMLSASASGQEAFEMSIYNQGILTYSLLYSIVSGGGLTDGRFIDINNWFSFASSTVKTLSKEVGKRQDPQQLTNSTIKIGMIDSAIIKDIKISSGKNLFKKSTFFDAEATYSNEELASFMDEELYQYSFKGKNSPFAFYKESASNEAYSVNVKYTENANGMLEMKIAIYKGKKIVPGNWNPFTIVVKNSEKKEMANQILEKILSFL